MGDHCMVISGEWKCSPEGKWDFVIDKQRMSRVVSFQDGMTIDELKRNVFGEFFADGGCGMVVDLSYWPPNTNELATGITTPPVMVTSSPSISYFCKHYSVKRSMNLFATFGKRPTSTPLADVGVPSDSFTTPKPTMKRSRFSDDASVDGRFGLGIENSGDYGSSAGSRKPQPDFDDELIAKHMERVENALGRGSHTNEDLYSMNTTSNMNVQANVDEMARVQSGKRHMFAHLDTGSDKSVHGTVDEMARAQSRKCHMFDHQDTASDKSVHGTVDEPISDASGKGFTFDDLNTDTEQSVHESMADLMSELSGKGYNSDDLNTDEEDNGQ
ncbi:unnamed protein product [Microthlaspi erraticum]|uniref:Uncharacterized protein n=1 Tax=Microthlaspi erraticum TaxID=1685480 RepID=A0A6D2ICX0_9BRAS|nr:unnamed protein product [Microthlaspi erraticum]